MAATTATNQRRSPIRPFRGSPATAIAPMQPASAGHWKFMAAIGNITVVKAASTTGTKRAPTASSASENHLLSSDSIAAARANVMLTMARTYQPSLWNAPA